MVLCERRMSFAAASHEQESYYREVVKKIQAAPVGYIPPNRFKLAGPLLDECYKDMWKRIEQRDPNCSRAMRYGSCYVSDGWDSVDNLPLINSAFITGNDGGIYWRSVDTSGKEKKAEYCAALMIAEIYEYGPLKLLLVITDTCPTMKKCWSIVMDEFPWIMVLPCQAHMLSLLMKDIGTSKKICEPPFSPVLTGSLAASDSYDLLCLPSQAKALVHEEGIITQWFSNHHFPLAKLREYTVKKLGGPCELVKAAATRFGSNTLVGERLVKLGACRLHARMRRMWTRSMWTRATPRRIQALGAWCARIREAPRASYASTTALLLVFGRAVPAMSRPAHSR